MKLLQFAFSWLSVSLHGIGAASTPSPAPPGEATAAAALAKRVVGSSAEQFVFELLPLASGGPDRFELPVSSPGKITIQGTGGVALASGFHWYLKYVAGVDVSYGNVHVPSAAIPSQWPGVDEEISMESPVQWRYYMNVVTHSYAAAWWDWPRWEQEIDWMAMMGINMPLAFTGQEYIWDKVYREKFGLTEEDMAEHFAGPAFLAWGRMGNIRGWGGWMDAKDGKAGVSGLTANWMKQQADLQRSIVARERSFGMRTVLPGFAGHVPLALAGNMSRSHGWCGFRERYSQDGLLDVTDPLFKEIGAAFIELQTQEFGTDHIYNGDTFNEMKPSRTDADYVASWGAAVYDAMRAGDPEAIWFVQGWSLHGWSDDELQAYWSKVPSGRLLSLDLNCAQSGGSWQKYTAAVSPPRTVVCGLLDNMGGKRALGGNLDLLAHQLLDNIDSAGLDEDGNPLIGGLGWNPEDLHQNPIKWHLLGEVGWRNREHAITNITEWVRQYAVTRYAPHGSSEMVQSAWDLLHDAAYRKSNHATSFAGNGLCRLPSFNLRSGTTKSNDPQKVIAAAQMLIHAANAEPGLKSVESFNYDLVDVVRQTLQDRFADAYNDLVDACGDAGMEYLDTFSRAVPHGASNCAGGADPSQRMPGCGHEFGSPCDPLEVQAWCKNLTERVPGSKPCTMASTNGYIWTSAAGSNPYGGYPLDCYIRDTTMDPKCAAAINASGSDILELAHDLDKVLATDEHFLLGRWIHDARAWGATPVEQDWLEFNARVQVTLWGTTEANGASISDYAAKQWAGLVSGYYIPLWQRFLGGVAKGENVNVLHKEILLQAEQWTNSTKEQYTTEPLGDAVDIASAIIAKWFGFSTFV